MTRRPQSPSPRKEADIQRDILNYCQVAGIFAKRRQLGSYIVGNRRVKSSAKSQADVWGILRNGRHFECEVKKPGEKPSDEQAEWLAECARMGAVAFWTDSLDGFIAEMERVSPRCEPLR